MDITAIAAIKALDGLALRQTVAANNIANANSPDFVASGVTFEAALRDALETGDIEQVQRSAISQISRFGTPGFDSGAVRLDQEVASMSETTLNYQLLVSLLDRKLSTAKMAMNDGRNS